MAVNNAPHPVVCARLEGVLFGYRRGVRVFDGLDLEIPDGRTVLLGPNGAGKTTLLGLLTGLLVPRRGRVCLTGGQSARGRWARRHVGHLPQSVTPVRGLTVVEQIAFAGWLKGMRRAQAAAAASEWVMRLDLDDVARRPASALSGGQRRRMGLASALVHAPDIAILDEPTAGLDPAQRWKFRELLSELASSIPSWIVSTHDVEDLSENYDHCVVLGRDPWSGTPAELAGLVAAGPRRYERACAELM